jgi:hypothetical protein
MSSFIANIARDGVCSFGEIVNSKLSDFASKKILEEYCYEQ